jgi:hypothetical protein
MKQSLHLIKSDLEVNNITLKKLKVDTFQQHMQVHLRKKVSEIEIRICKSPYRVFHGCR